jgi:hypothetical protein
LYATWEIAWAAEPFWEHDIWLLDDEAGASLVSYFCSTLAKAEKEGRKPDYAEAQPKAKRWVRAQEKVVLIGPGDRTSARKADGRDWPKIGGSNGTTEGARIYQERLVAADRRFASRGPVVTGRGRHQIARAC